MRVLVFHGYLLRGTGSNIYNTELARWLVKLGHEVHLFCQDGHAAEFDFVDAVGRWPHGQLEVEIARRPARCTAYLPDIGGILPVYVADHYAGFDARTFPELTGSEIERYIAANAAAVRDVVAAVEPEAALANHVVMGPVILARALGGRIPYAVKIHGSALEYTVRPDTGRFGPYAREGLAGAAAVLVGSRHTAESLWEVVGMPGLPARTRLLPPGVDVRRFRPRPAREAKDRLRALAARLEADPPAWGGEPDAAQSLRAADPTKDRIVSFVGKLIVSKGVDLLIAAWPLVIDRAPDARLMIAGFGAYRPGLLELVRTLGEGDLAAARVIARRGRELEGGPPGELHFLAAFLDGLTGIERERYLNCARAAMRRVHFTGRIEHDDVSELMCVSQALVIPSTFPEAFGMVLAEAACCGSVPLSAAHSGLAEVTAVLAPALRQDLRAQLSFQLGPGAVREIAGKLAGWLSFTANTPDAWRQASAALTEVAGTEFGWPDVANGVLAAAQGRLAELTQVPPGLPLVPAALTAEQARNPRSPAGQVRGGGMHGGQDRRHGRPVHARCPGHRVDIAVKAGARQLADDHPALPRGQRQPRQGRDPDAPRHQAEDGAESLELPRHRGRAPDAGQQPVDRLAGRLPGRTGQPGLVPQPAQVNRHGRVSGPMTAWHHEHERITK